LSFIYLFKILSLILVGLGFTLRFASDVFKDYIQTALDAVANAAKGPFGMILLKPHCIHVNIFILYIYNTAIVLCFPLDGPYTRLFSTIYTGSVWSLTESTYLIGCNK